MTSSGPIAVRVDDVECPPLWAGFAEVDPEVGPDPESGGPFCWVGAVVIR